jgi:two-component system, NtrC family, nitrogen regulation sensor histidine kinase NtrY
MWFKQKIVAISFFFLSIICGGLGIYLYEDYFKSSEADIDKEHFQRTILKKEHEVNSLLVQLVNDLQKVGYEEIQKGNSLIWNTELSDTKGFSFFIYRNDSLIFWTDNRIAVPQQFTKSILEQKVVKLNNGWYVSHQKKYDAADKYLVVGLILVKNSYTIENEFLKEMFHPDFKTSEFVKVNLISLSYSSDIFDVDDNFLFSLEPTNRLFTSNPHSILTEVLIILSIIFLLLFIHTISKNSKRLILLFFILLGTARALMLFFKKPVIIYSLSLFGREYFAQNQLLPSLGDLFLNTLVVFYLINNLHRLIRRKTTKEIAVSLKVGWQYVTFFISIIIFTVLFAGVEELIKSLVFNSSISFEVYKVQSLEFHSFIGFTIIAFLFASLVILSNLVISVFKNQIPGIIIIISLTFICAAYIAINQYFKFEVNIYSILSLYFLFMSLFLLRGPDKVLSLYGYLIINLILSIYLVILIIDYNEKKEKEKSKVLITRLITERDPIAEHLLADIREEILQDIELKQLIISEYYDLNVQTNYVSNYLQNKYFQGYWGKYDLEITICGSSKRFNPFPRNFLGNCKGFFSDLIRSYGTDLPFNYYFLDWQNGSISYLGAHDYVTTPDSSIVTLYIKLDSQAAIEKIGYPELLLDNKLKRASLSSEYSYAKYKNRQLISKTGIYPYKLVIDKPKSINDYIYYSEKDFDHLVYFFDQNNVFILSKPSLKIIDALVFLAYALVFFNIILFSIFIKSHLDQIIAGEYFNFKNKLQFAMLGVLLLSFLLVGGGTIYYYLDQFKQKHEKNISEKSHSILAQLEQIFEENTEIKDNWSRVDYRNIEEMLINFSNVFFIDINLYNPKGELIATSRPEIFGRELTGRKISSVAYREIVHNHASQYIHDETIGKLNYSSAYVPLRNSEKQLIGIVNLPYFAKPGLLKKEITTVVIAIVNLYVILFLITTIIAVFIANKITQPLRLIESRFRGGIELGKQNEPIDYKGHDEVASLVREYNRMLIELSKSAELLAKSERESAWREMAKQIAHEIKNPLTPMRLSVQFLKRSWDNKDHNFESRFENVTQTLVEQIDNLSRIATEFSSFAKMPHANNEVVNLVSTLKNILTLYEHSDEAEVFLQLFDKQTVEVFADKEQLSRVFINLVKNGIQAIPKDRKGRIDIILKTDNEHTTVLIKDNGTGIADDKKEAIFIPNFTTKTSGMGLGLAIVKNIIQNARGKIWFETEVGIGSVFFVQLPVYK